MKQTKLNFKSKRKNESDDDFDAMKTPKAKKDKAPAKPKAAPKRKSSSSTKSTPIKKKKVYIIVKFIMYFCCVSALY